MRVTLIHNPAAGAGAPTRAELMAWLADAGWDAVYQSTREEEFPHALEQPGDLVLVAGGDGTVGKVIRHLDGTRAPVAILPLGTANNVARSLGVFGTPPDIVAGLTTARPRRLDTGSAVAPWGTARFIESAGLGLFASVLRDARQEQADSHHDAGRRDLIWGRGDRMRRLLASEPAVRRWIEVDGFDLSGECLFVAALNIPFIGPQLGMAPAADPADGCLDLLIVRADHGPVVDEFLSDVTDGADVTFPIPTERCREVRLLWSSGAGHLDDKPWPRGGHAAEDGALVTLGVDANPVTVLVGAHPP